MFGIFQASNKPPKMSITPMYQLANGVQARVLSAKELVATAIWKNNRIIDHGHVEEIRKAVNPRHLDNSYHIAIVAEEDAAGRSIDQRYIVDGQHRVCVLRRYFEEGLCEADFPVLVFERRFATEGELIDYFNAINQCKPVQPWIDENLVLNNYVRALEEVFENRKTRVIRPGGCHRPYLSAEKIRDALRGAKGLVATAKGAEDFATRVKAWNDRAVGSDVYVLGIRSTAKRGFFEKGVKVGFVLAYDDKFPWIHECLR
jgi:hypothetical protein